MVLFCRPKNSMNPRSGNCGCPISMIAVIAENHGFTALVTHIGLLNEFVDSD